MNGSTSCRPAHFTALPLLLSELPGLSHTTGSQLYDKVERGDVGVIVVLVPTSSLLPAPDDETEARDDVEVELDT